MFTLKRGLSICCAVVGGILSLGGCAANSTNSTVPLPTTGPTAVAAVTETAVPTAIDTLTATPSPTAVPTHTPTYTPSPSPSATATVTPLPTITSSPIPTAIPTQTPIPLPTAVPILPLSAIPANLDAEVTVSGQVVATASFAQGFKFTLDDGTGQVTLLMWGNVYDDCWDALRLNIGATVRTTGTVGQFEGQWQVVPDFGGDVKVVTAPTGLPAERPIPELGNYINQRITVVGQVGRVENTGSAVRLFVTDGTDEILIFIWNNIFTRIPNNQLLLTPGTPIRVVGYVTEFRSNRQIVPALPFDVETTP